MHDAAFIRPLQVSTCLLLACLADAAAQSQTCVQFPTRNLINPALFGPGFPRGQAVAASGNTLLLGQAHDATLGPSAWVMESVAGAWKLQATLYPWDGSPSGFGTMLAIDGDVAMVGAPFAVEAPFAGKVYVYRRQGGQWMPEQVLSPAEGLNGDAFGAAIAISGNTAIIGSPDDDEPFGNTGSAYIYRFDGAQWNLEQKLSQGVTPTGTRFGRDVSIEGDIVALTQNNRLRIFEFTDQASWVEAGWFNGFSADAQLRGQQVFASGGSTVGIFEKFEGIWMQVGSVTGSDVIPADGFGADFAIEGDLMVVTAPMKMDGVLDEELVGAAYVFVDSKQGWVETRKLLPGLYGEWQENIAASLAITSESVVFGSPNMMMLMWDGYVGSIFEVNLDDCGVVAAPDACQRPDCDHSGSPDECELAAGSAEDCNVNGVPDHCEQPMTYQLDDGSAEMAWGYDNSSAPGREVVFMNQFTVLPDHEFIDFVSLPWSVWYFPGVPVSIAIYDDPNNDGMPQDATLLGVRKMLSGYADELPSGTPMSRYTIPRTFVGAPGDSFFVGLNVWMGNKSHPFVVDSEGPAQSRSWVVSAPYPADVSDLSAFQTFQLLPTGDNLLIRAGTLDCNNNGTWDSCDISGGTSLDVNGNGTPDECETGLCLADIAPPGNPNGAVDVDDLLLVINNWGQAGDNVADIDGNNIVNVDDLLAVINAWGVCP